jgi:hypothetical protein
VVNVPLAICRAGWELGFPCSPDSPHPFIMTIRQLKDGASGVYSGSALERYYSLFRPATVADVLGLDGEGLQPGGWLSEPPLTALVPWRRRSPEAAAKIRLEIMSREAHEHRFGAESGEDWKYWGPTREKTGELEFRRLTAVSASIRKSGYRRHDGPDGDIVSSYILVREGLARMGIGRGQHRVAALAALGHKNVPVRIEPWIVVRREEAQLWPSVRDGVISERQAVTVFDRIFDGASPPSLSAVWPDAQAEPENGGAPASQ